MSTHDQSTGWQPINTAPRDGHGHHAERDVDLWHKVQGRLANCFWVCEPPSHRKNEPFTPCWMARSGGRAFNMGTDADFSHWMTKPGAPMSISGDNQPTALEEAFLRLCETLGIAATACAHLEIPAILNAIERRVAEKARTELSNQTTDSGDTVRLDWILRHTRGNELRRMVGVLSDTSNLTEFRAAVDLQMGRETDRE